jgi:sarcosine oxidase
MKMVIKTNTILTRPRRRTIMNHPYDIIVIGLGGMGSAAAWQLARRGMRVLGLEQFAFGHDRGSSHGHTRIIRQAYYEHPAYVPLVRRACQGWYELEQHQGVHLLTSCPCLTIGPPEGELVAGVRRSAREHDLPIDDLSPTELALRYPAFRFGDDVVGVVEHTAGFLYVDRCVQAQLDEARRLGAELRAGESVLGWEAWSRGVAVRTTAGEYHVGKLVVTAGPWAGRLLGRCGSGLTVMRQVVFWLGVTDEALFRRDRFPVFIASSAHGYFYGLPAVDLRGVKIARHYGADELTGPEAVDRSVTPADEAPVREFVRAHLPDADGPCRNASVCLYTLTRDRHSLIDIHPDSPDVVFAAGFSGHGFKFAPVVGEVLADLAMHGRTDWPVELFRADRPATAPVTG